MDFLTEITSRARAIDINVDCPFNSNSSTEGYNMEGETPQDLKQMLLLLIQLETAQTDHSSEINLLDPDKPDEKEYLTQVSEQLKKVEKDLGVLENLIVAAIKFYFPHIPNGSEVKTFTDWQVGWREGPMEEMVIIEEIFPEEDDSILHAN